MLSLTPKDTEDKKKAEIIEIRTEAPDVKTFRLKIDLDFLPGQFIFLFIKIGGEVLKRAYSIASSPLDKGYIEITLKKEPHGKASTYLVDEAKVGDFLEISRPNGKFTYNEEFSSIVMIAGGSGVVPFRSFLRFCSQKKNQTNLTLFYSTRSEKDIIYRKELDRFHSANPRIIYTLTRDENWAGNKGRINSDLIRNNINEIKESHYFLCGPLEFIRSIVEILTQLGVDRHNIKREVWG